MSLTAKNVALNLGYYAVTVALLPWALLVMERHLGIVWRPSLALRTLGALVGLIGAALQLWCIVLFQRVGGGTPSPALPPERLVVAGAYRWVRNPMNLGELLVLLALAAWFASSLLVAYAAAAWLAFHTFVAGWEEPRMARRFGDDYARYRQAVGRWIPMPGRWTG